MDPSNQSLHSSKRNSKRKEQQDDSDESVTEEIIEIEDLPKKRHHAQAPKTKVKLPRTIQVLLAKNREDQDPTGWWVSEKLDGVRCYWNGKSFMSRLNNEYSAPDFFTAGLPDSVSLDGELWLGRKMFQECVSIAKCHDNGKHDMTRWHRMTYMIFDSPSLDMPFEERMEFLKALIPSCNNPYIELVEQKICKGEEHLLDELDRVEELGGEGLMLRKPKSYYENRRSDTLLKVKTFCDAEAVVIGYEKGKGKNTGLVGALKVRSKDGVEFKIGSGLNDQERARPPKIGSTVTYKFQELSKEGKPRFPTYVRERTDATL